MLEPVDGRPRVRPIAFVLASPARATLIGLWTGREHFRLIETRCPTTVPEAADREPDSAWPQPDGTDPPSTAGSAADRHREPGYGTGSGSHLNEGPALDGVGRARWSLGTALC